MTARPARSPASRRRRCRRRWRAAAAPPSLVPSPVVSPVPSPATRVLPQQGGYGQQPGYPGAPQQGGYPGQPGQPGQPAWQGQQYAGGSGGGGINAKLLGIIGGGVAAGHRAGHRAVRGARRRWRPEGRGRGLHRRRSCSDAEDLVTEDVPGVVRGSAPTSSSRASRAATTGDFDIEVKDEKIDGDKATVEWRRPAASAARTARRRRTFNLVKEDGDWKIDSIG